MIPIWAAAVLLLGGVQDDPSVLKLLADLESEDVGRRDQAEAALLRRVDDILPTLERARATASLEAAGRIDSILRVSRAVWTGRAAVDFRTGRAIWSATGENEDQRLLGVEWGRDLFLCTGQGGLERRSLRLGTVLWSAGPMDAAEGSGVSPGVCPTVCVGPRIVVRLAANSMRANARDSGKELWRTSFAFGAGDAQRRQALVSENAVVVFTDGGIRGYDASTGRPTWLLPEVCFMAHLLPAGDMILSHDGSIGRYRTSDGSPIWKVECEREDHARRLIAAGPWIVGGSDRRDGFYWTACFNPETGRETWRTAGRSLYSACASPDGKTVFVAAGHAEQRCGWLFAIDVHSRKEIWSADWNGDQAAIAFGEGRLFLAERQKAGSWLRSLDPSTGKVQWAVEPKLRQLCESEAGEDWTLDMKSGSVVLVEEASRMRSLGAFHPRTGAPQHVPPVR